MNNTPQTDANTKEPVSVPFSELSPDEKTDFIEIMARKFALIPLESRNPGFFYGMNPTYRAASGAPPFHATFVLCADGSGFDFVHLGNDEPIVYDADRLRRLYFDLLELPEWKPSTPVILDEPDRGRMLHKIRAYMDRIAPRVRLNMAGPVAGAKVEDQGDQLDWAAAEIVAVGLAAVTDEAATSAPSGAGAADSLPPTHYIAVAETLGLIGGAGDYFVGKSPFFEDDEYEEFNLYPDCTAKDFARDIDYEASEILELYADRLGAVEPEKTAKIVPSKHWVPADKIVPNPIQLHPFPADMGEVAPNEPLPFWCRGVLLNREGNFDPEDLKRVISSHFGAGHITALQIGTTIEPLDAPFIAQKILDERTMPVYDFDAHTSFENPEIEVRELAAMLGFHRVDSIRNGFPIGIYWTGRNPFLKEDAPNFELYPSGNGYDVSTNVDYGPGELVPLYNFLKAKVSPSKTVKDRSKPPVPDVWPSVSPPSKSELHHYNLGVDFGRKAENRYWVEGFETLPTITPGTAALDTFEKSGRHFRDLFLGIIEDRLQTHAARESHWSDELGGWLALGLEALPFLDWCPADADIFGNDPHGLAARLRRAIRDRIGGVMKEAQALGYDTVSILGNRLLFGSELLPLGRGSGGEGFGGDVHYSAMLGRGDTFDVLLNFALQGRLASFELAEVRANSRGWSAFDLLSRSTSNEKVWRKCAMDASDELDQFKFTDLGEFLAELRDGIYDSFLLEDGLSVQKAGRLINRINKLIGNPLNQREPEPRRRGALKTEASGSGVERIENVRFEYHKDLKAPPANDPNGPLGLWPVLPNGCEVVVLCGWTSSGYAPLHVFLPHQVTVSRLKDYLRLNPQFRSFYAIPFKSDESVEIVKCTFAVQNGS